MNHFGEYNKLVFIIGQVSVHWVTARPPVGRVQYSVQWVLWRQNEFVYKNVVCTLAWRWHWMALSHCIRIAWRFKIQMTLKEPAWVSNRFNLQRCPKIWQMSEWLTIWLFDRAQAAEHNLGNTSNGEMYSAASSLYNNAASVESVFIAIVILLMMAYVLWIGLWHARMGGTYLLLVLKGPFNSNWSCLNFVF